MSGKSKVLNIEFGRYISKVCVCSSAGKGYQIKTSFTFDTPENTFADGQINNAVELWYKLRRELRDHNVADIKDAIFTVGSNRIASREVTLPAVKESQIQAAVDTNAHEWFPVDISKYSLSYMLLDRSKEGVRINVVAVPMAILESYAALAEQSGLNVEAIDFAGNSQYQVLKALPIEGTTMFINVEPGATIATFVDNGEFLMQRSFAYGGNEFVAPHVTSDGENPYTDALVALSEEAYDHENAKSRNDESLERLVSNLARSADFFRAGKNADRPLGKVVLMGTCSHLAGLKEAVAERVGIETLWLEEAEGMKTAFNSVVGISTFIGCVGSNVAPLDLMPKTFAADGTVERKRVKEGGNYGVLVLIGCVIISAVLVVMAYMNKSSVQNELNDVNDRIDSISYVEDTYQNYITFTDGSDLLQQFYANAETPNAQLVDFLSELEEKMPSEIRILSATFVPEGVNMSVMVPTYEEAAVVINHISEFESVESVSVGSMAESADDAGVTQVQFELICQYVGQEQPEEEAPVVEEEAEDDLAEDIY